MPGSMSVIYCCCYYYYYDIYDYYCDQWNGREIKWERNCVCVCNLKSEVPSTRLLKQCLWKYPTNYSTYLMFNFLFYLIWLLSNIRQSSFLLEILSLLGTRHDNFPPISLFTIYLSTLWPILLCPAS